jgi:hypothetical protein
MNVKRSIARDKAQNALAAFIVRVFIHNVGSWQPFYYL